MTDKQLRETLERSISQELRGVSWGFFKGIPEWRQRSLTQALALIVIRDTRDLLNEIRAEAWDEGWGNCWIYHTSEGLQGEKENPYRPNEK